MRKCSSFLLEVTFKAFKLVPKMLLTYLVSTETSYQGFREYENEREYFAFKLLHKE
jgi:hypothetical protein